MSYNDVKYSSVFCLHLKIILHPSKRIYNGRKKAGDIFKN